MKINSLTKVETGHNRCLQLEEKVKCYFLLKNEEKAITEVTFWSLDPLSSLFSLWIRDPQDFLLRGVGTLNKMIKGMNVLKFIIDILRYKQK